jgi:DNA-binding NtrC family response regulator
MTAPRILVVDDEHAVRITLAANLELEGFTVVEAGSGEEALEQVSAQGFDLVITDIRMPGMNGVELYRRVRALQPTLPVLLMTAFAVEDLVQDALRDGAYMVVQKPFAIDRLICRLHDALHRPVILVIDDIAEVAESTAAALESLGVRARAVFDGEAALAAIAAGDIGVCVVDLVMPGMDGTEVIHRVRAVDPNIVFIAVTGHDVEELLRRAAEHAATILRKPVEPGDLLQAIARARGRP